MQPLKGDSNPKTMENTFKNLQWQSKIVMPAHKYLLSQCLEIDFNRISNTIRKNYTGLISMLQGFKKRIS